MSYCLRIILGVFAISLSACSLEASLEEINSKVPGAFFKATTAEVVANSRQGVVTSDGYRVQSSVSYYAAPAAVQTQQKYQVETSVQSSLYKEVPQ